MNKVLGAPCITAMSTVFNILYIFDGFTCNFHFMPVHTLTCGILRVMTFESARVNALCQHVNFAVIAQKLWLTKINCLYLFYHTV